MAAHHRFALLRAREARLKQQAEHDRMMTLYRQHVLGEKPAAGGFVPLHSVAPASSTSGEQKPQLREEVLGD